MSNVKTKKQWVKLLTQHEHRGTLYGETEKLALREAQAARLKAAGICEFCEAPKAGDGA